MHKDTTKLIEPAILGTKRHHRIECSTSLIFLSGKTMLHLKILLNWNLLGELCFLLFSHAVTVHTTINGYFQITPEAIKGKRPLLYFDQQEISDDIQLHTFTDITAHTTVVPDENVQTENI